MYKTDKDIYIFLFKETIFLCKTKCKLDWKHIAFNADTVNTASFFCRTCGNQHVGI